MDTCKNIEDLILTDYMDGQMEASTKMRLEKHLLSCPSCQAFAKEAKEKLQTPFVKSKRQEVPFELWNSIKDQIHHEEHQKVGAWDRFIDAVQGITLPKLVPVLVSFALIVFVSSTVFFNQQVKQANDQETGAYISFVLASDTTSSEVNRDLGTPIEQYFL